jgi:hypothetical protein
VSDKGNTRAFCRKLEWAIRSLLEGTLMVAKTQERWKVIVLAVLIPLAIILTVRWILNSETPTPVSTTCLTQDSAVNTTLRMIQIRPSTSPDPTLHYAQLQLTESEQHEGSGRNIFRSEVEDATKRMSPLPIPAPPAPAAQPAPEQMRLKFFGFASAFNLPRKIFLSEGDAIFVGSEEEIVDRRYRIGKAGSDSVEVEDLIDHSLHTLLLPG